MHCLKKISAKYGNLFLLNTCCKNIRFKIYQFCLPKSLKNLKTWYKCEINQYALWILEQMMNISDCCDIQVKFARIKGEKYCSNCQTLLASFIPYSKVQHFGIGNPTLSKREKMRKHRSGTFIFSYKTQAMDKSVYFCHHCCFELQTQNPIRYNLDIFVKSHNIDHWI